MLLIFSPTHRTYMDRFIDACSVKDFRQISSLWKEREADARIIRFEMIFWGSFSVFICLSAVFGLLTGIVFLHQYNAFLPTQDHHIITHVDPQKYDVCHTVLSCTPRKHETTEKHPFVTYHLGYMNHTTAMTIRIKDTKVT